MIVDLLWKWSFLIDLCKYASRCIGISFRFSVKSTGSLCNLCNCSQPAWTLSLSNIGGRTITAQFYHKRLNLLWIVQNHSMTIKQPVFFISKHTLDSFCMFLQVVTDVFLYLNQVSCDHNLWAWQMWNISSTWAFLAPYKHLICFAEGYLFQIIH